MRTKLTQIGADLGLVLERSVLERLGITRDTELEVIVDGGKLFISPAGADRRARVERAIDEVMADHAGTFRRLAQ